MAMRAERTMLSDAQWERIEPLCGGREGDVGRTGDENRRFVEAVLWVGRTGAPWRDLPPSFGKWNTVVPALPALGEEGRFQADVRGVVVGAGLRGSADRRHERAGSPACDWKKGGAEKSGRSRGGLTTKMVALVDAWGRRLSRFALLAGHRHESPAAAGLLSGLSFGALLADRGFDSDRLRSLLASLGAEAVVPPKSNRTAAIDCDMEKYARRHRVENFFCKTALDLNATTASASSN